MIAPARAVLLDVAARRAELGHENGGYVSEEFGLLPVVPPRTALSTSHREWDDVAASLPELFRSVTAREALAEMSELPAEADALDDENLLRAASLLGHFAHTYIRVRPDAPAALPACIGRPWETVCRRLGRSETALTYDDLVPGNWRFRDPVSAVRELDNLEVLTPTVANREERVFYMTQVEMLARGAPAIGAMVRAQEAAIARDDEAMAREVAILIDLINDVTSLSFLKIDPNPHSPTYTDPVVWAKTVAPFAVANQQGVHAISGAAAPLFQALDVFIGRRNYRSRVGTESLALKTRVLATLRSFMAAVGELSIRDAMSDASSTVRGLWNGLIDAYCGERGFLGVHRRKAYAYLEVAFKVGRPVTTGSFTGLFEDQTWEVAHQELEASRLERYEDVIAGCPVAHVQVAGRLDGDGLAHLKLDVTGLGLRFAPGDRLAIEPLNSGELVERTLSALRAEGDEASARAWSASRARSSSSCAGKRVLETEIEILKRATPTSRGRTSSQNDLPGGPRLVADGNPVATACRVLDVSKSGFYDWDTRPASDRDWDQAHLMHAIREAHAASYGTYGHRRVHAELGPRSAHRGQSRSGGATDALQRPAGRAPQAVAGLHPP